MTSSESLSIDVDSTIYPRKAVAATRLAFKSFCRVEATRQKSTLVTLKFSLLQSSSPETIETVVLEFMNYLLDVTADSYLDS
ncbi:hypothetical protein BMETH_162_2 [methanotrophic bacterial endosymbiont of Bathymodiolus sp.]|jgi:hypothetical protein|nr:hypothetical protein BMETH_162_2 [methanotrophic bacterial endosymbiont of Bathymodiolus sp.]